MRRYALLLLMLGLLGLLGLSSPAPVTAAPLQQSNACSVAVQAALSRRGSTYVWGAKGPNSFDCSGLTYWAYQQAGINIGGSTYDQQAAGVAIPCDLSDLNGASTTCWQPGDLAFLRYPGGQHVALYAGSGLFVDAYNVDTGVILHNPAADSFYRAHWWKARRPASCAGVTIDPGQPSSIPDGATPGIESIADILYPISLKMPWSCGDCEPADGVMGLDIVEYPAASMNPLYPFQWLGAYLWNELFRPLICWLLAIAQALLNALADAINMVIAGFNLLWRIGVLALLWVRDMFLNVWLQWAWLRLLIWDWYSSFWGVLDLVGRIGLYIQILGDLAIEFLISMGLALAQLGHLIWYVFALIIILGPSILIAIADPTTPAQFVGFTSFFLVAWFLDFFRALADSQLAWAWYGFVAIVYLAFVLWLMDEFATLNQ